MSLNDPKWGRSRKRHPQGPAGASLGAPALGGLRPNFNRRPGGAFGRRQLGAGEGPPRPPSARGLGGGASALIGLVAAVWLASGFYIVVEGTRGVVLTFG